MASVSSTPAVSGNPVDHCTVLESLKSGQKHYKCNYCGQDFKGNTLLHPPHRRWQWCCKVRKWEAYCYIDKMKQGEEQFIGWESESEMSGNESECEN